MRLCLLATVLALLFCAAPLWAQQVTLSTQMDYLLVEQGFRNPEAHVTVSGFHPRLNASLTGRLRPGSRLYLDLSGGLTGDTFGLSSQSTEDMRMVLRYEKPRYRLSLRHGRSGFTSATESISPAPSEFTSRTTDTDMTLILREPSWPALNLQYSRASSDSDLGTGSTRTDSTHRRIAANYDLTPLHFRLDDSLRSSESPGSKATEFGMRRVGVSLDTALFPKLNVYGDVQLAHSDIRSGGSLTSGTDQRIESLRLATELTPKVAVDAQLFSQLTNYVPANTNQLTAHGVNVSMRSEVWSGLQLNLTRSDLHSELRDRVSDTSTISADVSARIDGRNSLALTYSPSHASFAGAPRVEQTLSRLNWSSQLSPRMDLSLSLDRFAGAGEGFSNDTLGKSMALRYRPDLQTTLGLGVFSDTTNTAGPGGPSTTESRALDVEFSWLPTSDLSVGSHLNLSRFSGVSDSRVTVPAFDLRWQPDSKSDLSVSWRLQRELLQQADITNRLGSTAFSGRFSRRLSRGSTMGIQYDVLKFSSGPFAYERRLGLSFTASLGR